MCAVLRSTRSRELSPLAANLAAGAEHVDACRPSRPGESESHRLETRPSRRPVGTSFGAAVGANSVARVCAHHTRKDLASPQHVCFFFYATKSIRKNIVYHFNKIHVCWSQLNIWCILLLWPKAGRVMVRPCMCTGHRPEHCAITLAIWRNGVFVTAK
jgi:hypothetical protein